jgi:hypothetical protein
MSKNQKMDLYDSKTIEEFKNDEDKIVEAYDNVLKQYIKEDKLNLLP